MKIEQLVVGLALGLCAWTSLGSSVVTDGDNQLVYTVDAGETTVVDTALPSAVVRLVKRGAGTLKLTAASSSFAKPVDVEEGVMQVTIATAIGSAPTVTVSNGARFEAMLTGCAQSTRYFFAPQFLVSGSGPDGKGALSFSGGGMADLLYRRVKLLGDTVFGGSGRCAWGGLGLCVKS